MRKRWLAGLVLCQACASAPVVRNTADASLDAAHTRVLQGCYDCLLEARDVYQRHAAGKSRALVVARLFETELLIALREKELAMDPAGALDRARVLARELPPPLSAERYLESVEAMPPNAAGVPRSELAEFRQHHQAFVQRVDTEITWLASAGLSTLGAYLGASLDCAYAGRPRTDSRSAAAPLEGAPPLDPPLIRYRQSFCGRQPRETLEQLRADVPGFVEASYFLGRFALAMLPTGAGANPHALVDEVRHRFPESPAVTYLAASVRQAVGDCAGALDFFDQTLALKPRHEQSWLGRTICLTELKRSDEAIDSATRIVGLGLDNATQALYWRAWNRHARGELSLARADIDAARRGLTEDILTLSGIIEHDQDDLGPAEADLQSVRRMSSGRNCRALSYLASVFVKREVWPEAAAIFDMAMTCYERDVAARESTLASVERQAGLDPLFRRGRIAQLRDEIQAQRRGFFTSALHGANCSAAVGDLSKARALLDVAARDVELGPQVGEVRAYIDRLDARRAAGP
jgi:tetratricopeptide (TPR) repeat protein